MSARTFPVNDSKPGIENFLRKEGEKRSWPLSKCKIDRLPKIKNTAGVRSR